MDLRKAISDPSKIEEVVQMKGSNRKRILVLLTALSLVVSALAGCGGSEMDISGGGQVVLAVWSAPEGVFNSNLAESQYDQWCIEPMFDGLLKASTDLVLGANLAEDWSISDDGLTFYYKLRDDVKFHDGVKLTTADVAFTFKWMMHKDYTGVRYDNWQFIQGAEEYRAGTADDVPGIEVINDREINIHFTQVDAPAFYTLSTWDISPYHVFKDTAIGELENHPAITQPIGTGPFKFSNWVEDQYVEMVRNPDYHGDVAKLEKLILKVANQDVAQLELLTGNVDIAWVMPNADDWEMYEGTQGMAIELAIEEFPQNGYQYMSLNMTRDIFKDQAVRLAATYGINRERMVDGLLDGMGIIQVVPVASVSWAYATHLNPYPFDPTKAVQILEDAGYTKGGDGVWAKDGLRLEFELTYPTGNPVREDSALLIKEDLEAIGFKVNLKLVDFNTLSDQCMSGDRNFDAYLLGWGLGEDPDGSNIWHPDSTWNTPGFYHPDNLRLLLEGREVVPIEERRPIYVEWQELLYKEAPYVWLYSPNDAFVYNSSLKEFKPNPFGLYWDVEYWHWEGSGEVEE